MNLDKLSKISRKLFFLQLLFSLSFTSLVAGQYSTPKQKIIKAVEMYHEFEEEFDENIHYYQRTLKYKKSLGHEELAHFHSMAKQNYSLQSVLMQTITRHRKMLYQINISKAATLFSQDESSMQQFLSVFMARCLFNDIYIQHLSFIESNRMLRNLFNSRQEIDGDLLKDNILKHISKEFYSSRNYRDLKRSFKIYKKLPKGKNFYGENLILLENIQTSPTFKALQKSSGPKTFHNFIEKRIEELNSIRRFEQDSANKILRKFKAKFTKVFGLTIGGLKFRPGKLNHRKEVQDDVLSHLQPLDIILEKTQKASTVFIPGKFGHAALWLGTKKDLMELELWEHPKIRFFHKKLAKNHSILESKKQGVVLSGLDHFLNIDDLLVVRRTEELTKEEMREKILHALDFYDKGYDFEFSMEDEDKLYCSELIFHIFSEIPFDTDYNSTLGSSIITPDHIAGETLGSKKHLTPVLMYLKGNRIEDESLENHLSEHLDR